MRHDPNLPIQRRRDALGPASRAGLRPARPCARPAGRRGLDQPLQAAGDDPRALIRGFVRAVLGVAMAHPWLPRLWVREVLHEGGGLRGLMLERIAPLPRALAARFASAQAAGRLNPRIDARLLVPSLIGQTMFMAASAPIWRGVLGAALLEQGLELNDEDA
jgi:hypothetical protein